MTSDSKTCPETYIQTVYKNLLNNKGKEYIITYRLKAIRQIKGGLA